MLSRPQSPTIKAPELTDLKSIASSYRKRRKEKNYGRNVIEPRDNI